VSAIIDDLQARAIRAMAAWDLQDQTPQLLKYRENAVFKVRLAHGQKAALRLHRPGYHSECALLSELHWMDDLRRNGLRAPEPIAASDGRLLISLDGDEPQFADLIDWVDGVPLGESGAPLAHGADELEALFHDIGASMARMHEIADRWRRPAHFSRPQWDANGLLGEQPVWGRFWDVAGLAEIDRRYLVALRGQLGDRLAEVAETLDFGLVHADLVRENVFIGASGIAFIDFDDCGFGWRLFDIATTLLRNRHEPLYQLIEAALIRGYRSQKHLSDADLAQLPLFLLLRSLTYIGWVGARPELPDSAERLARYVAEARALSDAV
jgi:Ser/Thr protein kinase RdoA (MazF antagonist)